MIHKNQSAAITWSRLESADNCDWTIEVREVLFCALRISCLAFSSSLLSQTPRVRYFYWSGETRSATSWFGNTYLTLCIWDSCCSFANILSAFCMSWSFDNKPQKPRNMLMNELGYSDLTRYYNAPCKMHDKGKTRELGVLSIYRLFAPELSCCFCFVVSFLRPFKLANVFLSSHLLLLMCDLACCN